MYPGRLNDPPYAEADWPAGVLGPCLFDRIGGVVPLDAQLGRFPPDDVPPALEPLFAAGPVHALIDAALVPGLAGMLAGSGLEHRCLYRGVAEEDWADVAPWLVRLEPGSFTRGLFTDTGSGAPWELWPRRAAVLMTGAPGFDALWSRLRKFTRVETDDGEWLLLRFWERHLLPALCAGDDPALAAALLADIDGAAQRWLFAEPGQGALLGVGLDPAGQGASPRVPRLSQAARAALDAGTDRRHLREEVAAALATLPAEFGARFGDDPRLAELRATLLRHGFSQREHRSEGIALYLRAATAGQQGPAWQMLIDGAAGPAVRLDRLKKALAQGKMAEAGA